MITYKNFRGLSFVRYITKSIGRYSTGAGRVLTQWIDGIYLQGLDAAWKGGAQNFLLMEVNRNLGLKHLEGQLTDIKDANAVYLYCLQHPPTPEGGDDPNRR